MCSVAEIFLGSPRITGICIRSTVSICRPSAELQYVICLYVSCLQYIRFEICRQVLNQFSGIIKPYCPQGNKCKSVAFSMKLNYFEKKSLMKLLHRQLLHGLERKMCKKLLFYLHLSLFLCEKCVKRYLVSCFEKQCLTKRK